MIRACKNQTIPQRIESKNKKQINDIDRQLNFSNLAITERTSSTTAARASSVVLGRTTQHIVRQHASDHIADQTNLNFVNCETSGR